MRISDWSSDVCSSDLTVAPPSGNRRLRHLQQESRAVFDRSTVGVGPLVGPVLQKLVRQVAVVAVDLDAVAAGPESALGAGADDRKSVEQLMSVPVRIDLVGRHLLKNNIDYYFITILTTQHSYSYN